MKKILTFSMLNIFVVFCTYSQCLPLPEQPARTATVNDESDDNDADDNKDNDCTNEISEEERKRNATELNVRVKAYVKKKRTDAFRRAILESKGSLVSYILNGSFEYGLCPSQQADINEAWEGKKPIEVALNLLIFEAKKYRYPLYPLLYRISGTVGIALLIGGGAFSNKWVMLGGVGALCFKFYTALKNFAICSGYVELHYWDPLREKMDVVQTLLKNEDLALHTTTLNLSTTEVQEALEELRISRGDLGFEKFVHAVRAGTYDCLLTAN